MVNTFKKQLLTQLGLFFGVSILVIVATQIAAGNLAANADKIQSQKSELAFRIQATQQLASLKADSAKAEPLFQKLNSILPVKDDLINFGQSLIDLAKSEKVDLGFSFGGEVAPKDGTSGYIKFSLTGSGSYENFQKFLKDLEKVRYFIKLNSVDMTRQPGSANFSFVSDGQVFYQ